MNAIRFNRDFIPFITAKRKTMTTRWRRYGNPGVVLEVQDQDGIPAGLAIRINDVVQMTLGEVARRLYYQEGFGHRSEFVRAWSEIYGDFDGDVVVFVHEFEVV